MTSDAPVGHAHGTLDLPKLWPGMARMTPQILMVADGVTTENHLLGPRDVAVAGTRLMVRTSAPLEPGEDCVVVMAGDGDPLCMAELRVDGLVAPGLLRCEALALHCESSREWRPFHDDEAPAGTA